MPPTPPEKPQAIVPEFGADCSQPCLEGFAGLTEKERARHSEILCRAYSIWECQGRPKNNAVADWLAAEKEVVVGGR